MKLLRPKRQNFNSVIQIVLRKAKLLGFFTCTLIMLADIAIAANKENSATPSYIYWHGSGSDARKPYEVDLIRMLLVLSEDKFGKANITVSAREMSNKRMLKNLKHGDGVHVMFSPAYTYNQSEDKESVIVLPHRVMKNLLGYRQLIVRNEDVAEYSSIESGEAFKRKLVGLVAWWGDVDVMKHNNVDVVEAPRFKGLFTMLKFKRFDYISLGAIEARATFNAEELDKQNFTLLNDLILYYPWPVQIMVSKTTPELAERLDYGMQKAKASGQFDALFSQYFNHALDVFNIPDTKIIIFKTPLLPALADDGPDLLSKGQILQ